MAAIIQQFFVFIFLTLCLAHADTVISSSSSISTLDNNGKIHRTSIITARESNDTHSGGVQLISTSSGILLTTKNETKYYDGKNTNKEVSDSTRFKRASVSTASAAAAAASAGRGKQGSSSAAAAAAAASAGGNGRSGSAASSSAAAAAAGSSGNKRGRTY